MKKLIVLLCSLFLVGCEVEEEDDTAVEMQGNKLTGTFMLQAEPGYIRPDNEEDARVYIINTNNNTVHIEGQGKSFTREDIELMEEGMTGEELEELFGMQEAEDPQHDLTYLEAPKDVVVLEYADERLEFTALSDSFLNQSLVYAID